MSANQLIPEIILTDFQKLKATQLKRLKSCEVMSDGEYLFTFVNGMTEPSGYLRTQVEFLSQTANAVGGATIEQLLAEEKPKEAVPVPFLVKSRRRKIVHRKSHKLVEV